MTPRIEDFRTDWLEKLLETARDYPAFVAFSVDELERELSIRAKEDRVEARFRELVSKEALGTITPEESRKLERYTALRRSRIPPETREARVRAYRERLLRKALTTIVLGRAPTRAEVRVQMEALRAQVREDAKAWV